MKKLSTPTDIRQELYKLMLEYRNGGGQYIYGVANLDRLKQHFDEYEVASVSPSRIDLNLCSKVVYTSTEGRILDGTDHLYLRESRFLNRPLTIDFTVIGDHVMLLNGTNAYFIHSPELARDYQSLFDVLWYSILE